MKSVEKYWKMKYVGNDWNKNQIKFIMVTEKQWHYAVERIFETKKSEAMNAFLSYLLQSLVQPTTCGITLQFPVWQIG